MPRERLIEAIRRLQPVAVELVLPAQVEQHLRLRHPVPAVVRQLHVPHRGAGPVLPLASSASTCPLPDQEQAA